MKKILLSMLLVSAALFVANKSTAQVSVQVNIGDQPEWGPAGYAYAEYYYMPDIEAYYYVPRRQFVYLSGGRWVFAASLPPMYSHYNIYTGYKVVMRTPHAYRYFKNHRVRYAGYRNRYDQQVILVNKHDNGNHYGHYKNKGKGRGKGKH
ncbi:MAG: hypothetical protein IPJ02_15035 [Chitinophagaceae bacterium]|nr:hypothetical protein [Chitinophagaceae bacterium]